VVSLSVLRRRCHTLRVRCTDIVRTDSTYKLTEYQRAARWKSLSRTLPDAARVKAPWICDGRPRGAFDFCLPAEFAHWTLLPEVRDSSMVLFAELGIPWHQGIAGGPGNHLLSSQVQCVNALGQMVHDPDRLARTFKSVIDVGEITEIEPGRYLTFEYIGPTDYLGESPGAPRTRGSMCTSVDAAFAHHSPDGVLELVIIEWKYTEHYDNKPCDPLKDQTRRRRYESDWAASDGPIRSDLVPFESMLAEPFYQLMRQQLLAHRIERDPEHPAERVRVVHAHPPANLAFQLSVHDSALGALGDTVDEIWAQLLRSSSRYTTMDPAIFCAPRITSDEYAARYGPTSVAGSEAT
jgi:hypothetical protein